MGNEPVNLECTYLIGPENYGYDGPFNYIKIENSDDNQIAIVTTVQMVSGSHITDCEVIQSGNDVTLVYKSHDNGVLCLEQYSCGIRFTISDSRLSEKPNFKLENQHRTIPSE